MTPPDVHSERIPPQWGVLGGGVSRMLSRQATAPPGRGRMSGGVDGRLQWRLTDAAATRTSKLYWGLSFVAL